MNRLLSSSLFYMQCIVADNLNSKMIGKRMHKTDDEVKGNEENVFISFLNRNFLKKNFKSFNSKWAVCVFSFTYRFIKFFFFWKEKKTRVLFNSFIYSFPVRVGTFLLFSFPVFFGSLPFLLFRWSWKVGRKIICRVFDCKIINETRKNRLARRKHWELITITCTFETNSGRQLSLIVVKAQSDIP